MDYVTWNGVYLIHVTGTFLNSIVLRHIIFWALGDPWRFGKVAAEILHG